jgi:hypothetical protein
VSKISRRTILKKKKKIKQTPQKKPNWVGLIALCATLALGIFLAKTARKNSEPANHQLGQAQKSSRTTGESPPNGSASSAPLPSSPITFPTGKMPDATSSAPPMIIPPPTTEKLAAVCFTETFKHKALASHEDGEACLHHQNLIKLARKNINPRTLCVRVNGSAVKFKVLPQNHAVLIGASAGPHAEITVRYCTGRSTCHEGCKIAKDEFLSAIGGDEAVTSNKGWNAEADGAGHSTEDTALKKEVEQLNRDTQTDGTKTSIFKDWVFQKENLACNGKTSNGK